MHKQVSIFIETLMNIFSNFTPKKLVSFDDRDPLWISFFICQKKNGIHSMQDWTATTGHGVTRKKKHKKNTAYRKSVWKVPTAQRCLIIPDLKPLRS